MVKSQTGFATWDEYEWVGTLSALRGGEGYQYLSGRDASRTFHYPAYSASAASRKAPRMEVADPEMAEAASAYASNMNTIVIVQRGGEPVEAQIRVVDAEGNLRGVSRASIRDDRHFVTIAGDTNGDALKFIVTVDGYDCIVPGTLYFTPDAVIGTLKAPFVIELSSPTGIGIISLDDAADYTYDVSGRIATNMSGVQVVISDGRKTVLKR